MTRSDGTTSRFDNPSVNDQFRQDQAPPLTQVANFGSILTLLLLRWQLLANLARGQRLAEVRVEAPCSR